MDMVEKVARAICRSDYDGEDQWDGLYGLRYTYLENARAAIEAMGDLDETIFALAMHEIDDRRGPSREGKQVFREFFRAAFDAALSSNREGDNG